ncbi:MAG TPA: HEAT repeat domain-containing protein [Pirellulaceae bacterium]|nr:HEAT repeat domain-containing protein [Pirellulaceae bacterium]
MIVAHADAQDARTDAGRAKAILAEFEGTWDDKSWGPSEGRVGKYMRPMDDVGWKSRMAAFQRIVQHDPSAVPDLVKALDSESAPVRALAAQVLGYCGTADAKPALPRVVERDADAMVRLYAADSLGMLGGRDHDDLFRRLEPNEKNRDTKRHIGYLVG